MRHVFVVCLVLGGCVAQERDAKVGVVQSEVLASSVPSTPLGMNPSAVTYYSSALPFIDLMRNAEPFMSSDPPGAGGPWNTNVAHLIPRDPDGYPLELPYKVSTLATPQVLRTATARLMYVGDYVLLYTGDGDFSFLATTARVVSSVPGRIVLRISKASSETLFVTITRSNKADHVRNMRLLLPTYETRWVANTFHPTYLAGLQGVSTLRFMDWGRTNGSYIKTWSQRARVGIFQGGGAGVALETMIDLANGVGANAWFCVPHQADDNYVQLMATVIKNRLGPNQRVYVEYSNELWNGMFSQGRWTATQGCAAGLDRVGPYSGNCATSSSAEFWAGEKYNARRSAQIFEIFSQVFGGSSRLVRVLAGQAANAGLNDGILNAFHDPAVNPLHGRPGADVDALAIAPYFAGNVANTLFSSSAVAGATVDDVIGLARNALVPEVAQRTRANRVVADKYGIDLIAYEGGQHLAGMGNAQNDASLTQLLMDANRDQRMYSLYRSMFDAWYAESRGGLFMTFAYVDEASKYGSWGVLESQTQNRATAPKYNAFRDELRVMYAP